jgi:hypothetical protein
MKTQGAITPELLFRRKNCLKKWRFFTNSGVNGLKLHSLQIKAHISGAGLKNVT